MTGSRWARQLPVPRLRDPGFTLVELTVAMMVIAIALLGLMAVQVRSLNTIALAGQRQAAAQLANRAMEQLRALPYGTVAGGMVCSDLSGDANLVATVSGSGCTAAFRPAYDTSIDETVVTQTGSQVAPVYPHRQLETSTKVGGTQFDVRTYVTRVNPDATVDAGYWLTVVSTWSSSATGGATKSLATRSQLYSPKGCLALTTHPFSGPCQAFLYTNAGVAGGGMSVSSSRSDPATGAKLPILDGLDATEATATLFDLSTRIQSEQVVSAQAQGVLSGGALTRTSGSVDKTGAATGSSVADTDAASGAVTSPTSATSVGPSGVGALSSDGAGSSLVLRSDGSETGSVLSTMAAAGSPVCADNDGTAVANGQPCTSAVASPGATTSSTTLALNSLGTRTMTLADLTPASTPSRAWGGRFVTGTSTHCTSTTGIGCVATGLQRSLGAAHAGGLPPLIDPGEALRDEAGLDVTSLFGSPAAPTPLVTVTGYSDKAQAESGLGAGTPSPGRTGTLSYWNGIGFSTVDLAASGTATYVVPTTTGVYGTTSVAVGGSVALSAPSRLATGSSPCATAACDVKAAGGAVVSKLTYTVSTASTVVGAFTVTLDLGTAFAQTTYKAAPSA